MTAPSTDPVLDDVDTAAPPPHAGWSEAVATAWAGSRLARTGAVVAFGLGIGGGAWAWRQHGDLTGEVLAVATGTAAAALLRWRGLATRDAATVALAAALAWVGLLWGFLGRPWSIAAALAWIVAAVWSWRALRPRLALARRWAWLAVGLAAVTSDRRPATDVLTPARGQRELLPLSWTYPPALALAPSGRDRVAAVAGDRLGVPVRIDWTTPGVAVISAAPAKTPAAAGGEDTKRLDAVLAHALRGDARVVDCTRDDSGRLTEVVWTWGPAAASLVAHAGWRRRLTRTLGTALGGEWAVTWQTDHDRAVARPMAPMPRRAEHPPREDAPAHMASLGICRGDVVLWWDMDAAEPHLLVVGGTGAGKTVLLRTIVAELQLMHDEGSPIEVHLFDPKIAALRGLDRLPVVVARYQRPEQMARALEQLEAEMMRRYEMIDADPSCRASLPRIVIPIDEARSMYEVLKQHWIKVERPRLRAEAEAAKRAGDDPVGVPTGNEHPAIECLRNIARLGREAKINFVLLTQQADADWLSTEARGNFGMRVAMNNLDRDSSQMTFGAIGPWTAMGGQIEGEADTSLPKGRAWVRANPGAPVRAMQVWWTPHFTPADWQDGDRDVLVSMGLGDYLADAAPADAVTAAVAPAAAPADAAATGDAWVEPSPSAVEGAATVRDEMPAAPPAVMTEVGEVEEEGQAQPREWVPVLDVDDGTVIVLDGFEGPITVVSIEPDDLDPESVAITYTDETGTLSVISVPEGETVGVLGDDPGAGGSTNLD